MPIPVIDVFAGPGGLNEGFSAHSDGQTFRTVASIEMDPIACQTLRLRAAVRRARLVSGALPTSYLQFLKGKISLDVLLESEDFAAHWKQAVEEVHQHELSANSRATSDELIRSALGEVLDADSPWVLIGGPPCQAYSMAGRSRRKHDKSFKDDHKHTLYREYLHIIQQFRPHVFVMENVKGMLSSKHDGGAIFQQISEDLRSPAPGLEYVLHSFTVDAAPEALAPKDFLIRAEDHGVPQARHRVILLGIRSDLACKVTPRVLVKRPRVSVHEAIGDLPKIRAGVSPKSADSFEAWLIAYVQGTQAALGASAARLPAKAPDMGSAFDPRYEARVKGDLGAWLRADAPRGIAQHTSRSHMTSDLARYAYLAHLGLSGRRPRVNELPPALMPRHANATRADAPFADRFRVQLRNLPSSTVTSHIAKDGHYYIHYDPRQMRSLSVREAARLQTFPDNYFFVGNRTQQYHQVGNAVPPFLAVQLADVVADLLGRGPSTD